MALVIGQGTLLITVKHIFYCKLLHNTGKDKKKAEFGMRLSGAQTDLRSDSNCRLNTPFG